MVFFVSLRPRGVFSCLMDGEVGLSGGDAPVRVKVLLRVLIFETFSFYLSKLLRSLFCLLCSSRYYRGGRNGRRLPFRGCILDFRWSRG